jgi:hypothetical protein
LAFDSVGKILLLSLFIGSDLTPCLRFGLPRPQTRAFGEAEQARWRLRMRPYVVPRERQIFVDVTGYFVHLSN